jgi:hypothetical protein
MIDQLLTQYQNNIMPENPRKVLLDALTKRALERQAKNREYQAAVVQSNTPGRR